MDALKFDEQVCATCPTGDCLVKCQYMEFDADGARAEMLKIFRGEDSAVLKDCVTCYACEEYCRRGNHPFYLIVDRQEEKGMLTAPRPITNQWINMTTMQGKMMTGAIEDRAMSCCFIPQLAELAGGEIFKDYAWSFALGAEYMCPAVFLHFARKSIIRERLPQVIDNLARTGAQEVLCMHDECYGTYTSIAPAHGIDVPFKPIYYMDYLYERLLSMKDDLRPLGVKVAYQRPCSNRLIPEKHHLVRDILDLIGADLPDREYQDENALCCGEVPRVIHGLRFAEDIQHRNIDDMLETGAEYCVFNCPACQTTLSELVTKKGLKPIHLIDLCKMAIGEKGEEV